MNGKQRRSVTVDADLVEAAEAAVARGRVDSVGAWVDEALRLKVAHDGRLQALDAFIAEYEAGHGDITLNEMRGATHRARARSVAARPITLQRPRRR